MCQGLKGLTVPAAGDSGKTVSRSPISSVSVRSSTTCRTEPCILVLVAQLTIVTGAASGHHARLVLPVRRSLVVRGYMCIWLTNLTSKDDIPSVACHTWSITRVHHGSGLHASTPPTVSMSIPILTGWQLHAGTDAASVL